MSRTFIYDPSIMPAAKFHSAAAKIQTLARSKRAKQTTATLRLERVRDRTAYKSYLTSHTQENTQGLQGWAGLELLYNFLPILRETLAKHKGLKFHVSAISSFLQADHHWTGSKGGEPLEGARRRPYRLHGRIGLRATTVAPPGCDHRRR